MKIKFIFLDEGLEDVVFNNWSYQIPQIEDKIIFWKGITGIVLSKVWQQEPNDIFNLTILIKVL